MEKIKDVSGVVLAGGISSRYGKNKALVEFHGIPLIERVLGVMRPIFRHVIIITNTPDKYSYLKLPMYQDIIKGLGPLGGIFTGLQVIPNSGFFVACDMPFLNQGLIRHMVEIKADFDLVVPRISGYMEALHSLYGRGCERKIESLINSGIYQVFRFFNEVSARYVDEDEVRMFDPDLRSFLNINSPEALNDFDNLF
ncbi:MAG: molybdenum cofactor guanylyltransferase [Desulfobacteraceae bacterium]|jgi:molybdopterin-guanine dinucleotide biosynthesis protein A|uniref:Probable molybdenum cofactor guanylyltransferase n=1 Tax=Candidatus Desulfacyla euxinica TaxID=2841693 RepID=A0A8J6MWH7_9DELT|nr:molybdenum cofactor guanylyltransferase [Candidatus Desulfacyla euxinica]MBL6978732.1 molybdenum cofactor guanylyltransferase [Desulfobacteraceae bacterium]MBL7217252.1 molybdenum cofactor guanylyltransferase [Desulfobacteraceae bacterium]